MREILFRGKRVDNGEWVEGSFYQHPMTKDCFILVHDYHSNAVYGFGNLGCPKFHKVDPDTLGEYTGLTDENGTKIFEGDILKYFDDEIQVVEWNSNFSQIMLHTYGTFEQKKRRKTVLEKFDGWNWLDDYPLNEMPIIGNIHDISNLIEGCKQ